MRIGVPRERKDQESRVGLVPDGVRPLAAAGHVVLVERGAGEGSGFADSEYAAAGARLIDAQRLWGEAELVVKVKEPQPEEIAQLSAGQALFCYLHLAAAPEVAQGLLRSGAIAIAYETIQGPDGSFPVLAPMSEVAGRLAVQVGVTLLQRDHGGKGLLLGGVPGVPRGRVTVIGAGTVGINAVRVAHALGAEVDVLDVDLRRLTYLYDIFRGELNTLYSNPANVERSVLVSDLVVGGVRLGSTSAPHRDRGHGPRHAARLGDRRRGRGPGRLHRDDPADDALRAHLRRPRGDPLRRHQHAGRRTAHLDLRAHQHHAPLRAAHGRARRGEGGALGPGARAGRQRLARRARLPGRRRVARVALAPAGAGGVAARMSSARLRLAARRPPLAAASLP